MPGANKPWSLGYLSSVMLKCFDGGGRIRNRRLSDDLFRIVSRISYVSPSSNW